ncbi:Uncharacterized protein Fot_16165 [Forsythia ovata]|uniref:Uncharacterized protein n=1 Tax=Forsythia ovata TaxID=205694 RepID=A0ABD1WBI7_9LAMI
MDQTGNKCYTQRKKRHLHEKKSQTLLPKTPMKETTNAKNPTTADGKELRLPQLEDGGEAGAMWSWPSCATATAIRTAMQAAKAAVENRKAILEMQVGVWVLKISLDLGLKFCINLFVIIYNVLVEMFDLVIAVRTTIPSCTIILTLTFKFFNHVLIAHH